MNSLSSAKWVWIIEVCLLATLAWPLSSAAQGALVQGQAQDAAHTIHTAPYQCSGRADLPPTVTVQYCKAVLASEQNQPSNDVPGRNDSGSFTTRGTTTIMRMGSVATMVFCEAPGAPSPPSTFLAMPTVPTPRPSTRRERSLGNGVT
jgi:hypothetical protein